MSKYLLIHQFIPTCSYSRSYHWNESLSQHKLVERQVNNLCTSLDHHRDNNCCVFSYLIRTHSLKLGFTEQITIIVRVFFYNLFWNQNKRFPNSNSFLTSSAQQKEASSSPSLSQRKTLFVLNTVVRIFDNIKELQSVSPTQVLMRDDHPARV